MRKRISNKLIRDEKGQALVLVLILILLGGLIITPMLSHMGTGLKVGKEVFEKKMDLFYAADSGVEDGLWQIKYDQLPTLFGDYDPYAYYAYSSLYEWDYDLTEDVNDKGVNVTIKNIWIPRGLDPPDKDVAEFVVEGDKEADPPKPPKVIITGNVPAANTFEIKIQYYPEVGDNFGVNTLGIWLPQGFDYDATGACDLDDRDPGPGVTPYYTSRQTYTHAGGKAVIWTFDNYPFVGDVVKAAFPGVGTGTYPMVSTITFKFIGPANRSPAAVSWIDTTLDLGGDDYDITYTWDADTKIYKIVSVAGGSGGTEVEAYVAKSEIRELGTAIAGDYRAIGNSLMVDTPPIDFSTGIRDQLLTESSSTVDDIPAGASAYIEAAYLYWSAWRNESAKIFSDTCSDFTKWDRSASGTRWTPSSGRFRGQGSSSATTEQRTLTMKNSLNLSSYAPGAVAVSWNQTKSGTLESTDALYYAFYNSSGWSTDFVAFQGDSTPTSPFTVTIPDAYLTSNFKMRFYFNFTSTSKYVYLDNISVMPADTAAIFKIDGTQVSFDGSGLPQTGGEITSSRSQVLPNYDSSGNPNGFSYACYKDVTKLVQTFSTEGNGTYTVGGVAGNTGNQWSYAGWSLVLIYTTLDMKGHQLYLYDDFIYAHNDTNIDFDHDGDPGGTISGFLVPNPVTDEVNAATLTCFVGEGDDVWNGDNFQFNGTKLWDGTEGESLNDVWNGQSLGMSADGVDIDTFYVTWASGLLEPGDTSAQIDLPTQTDSWNLVYIIISFRSETTTGGTISYLVRG